MSEPNTFRVPETVARVDFIKAITPLLDLLKVSGMEALPELHIVTDRISFQIVARSARDHDVELPHGIVLDVRPQEFAQLSWPCSVRIED